MAAKKRIEPHSTAGVTIQLHLLGIVVFSVALVLASALATYGFVKIRDAGGGVPAKGSITFLPTTNYYGIVDIKETNVPPWGQLVERDIDLQRPEEYAAYDIKTNCLETWTFTDMNPDAVRGVLQSSGLTAAQMDAALSPASMVYTNSSTVITPDCDLVFSLPPGPRSKLYSVLARFSPNELMQFPFCFPGNSFDTRVDKSKIGAGTLTMLKRALYPRGDAQCFSDLGALLRCIPDESDRLQTVEALSHQSAVLLGLRIWPDTDIDNIVNYWSAPGVRQMDLRPFLDSLKREPEGSAASILYFLPPFARQRLYTYPLPSQAGDPVVDCHWTTMNFFNETPDNRFSEPKYTVDYLQAHYYRIAKASRYGDRIFLLNQNGEAVHSAVYLAGDIVFTKNGNNAAQPWTLMHLKDLVAEYTTGTAPDVAVYRNKSS
jgi:hypothetical protein